MSEALSAHVSVRLFGSLRVRRGDVVLDARHLGGPKPRQILEILLLNLGTPVSKDRLIELLWSGNPPAEAQPTLESYVSVLRRHVQPGAGKTGPLQTANGGYVMERSLVDLDLDLFDTLFRRAQQAAPAEAFPLLCRALELASAPLLGDELLPAWAGEERSLHAARVTAARILAAETAAALHRTDESVGWANLALAGDPLNERAWAALLLGLERAGRYAEGLQSYERCRRAMDRELGCPPGRSLRATHIRLLHATADGDGELSEVLSALLVLHDELCRATVVTADHTPATAAPAVAETLREAGAVVHSFLRRALSPA